MLHAPESLPNEYLSRRQPHPNSEQVNVAGRNTAVREQDFNHSSGAELEGTSCMTELTV